MVIAKVNEEESAKKLWFAVGFFFLQWRGSFPNNNPVAFGWLVGWLKHPFQSPS